MNKRIDFHCHLLPGIDDGAKTIDDTLEIINTLKNNCFTSVVATPHFYYVEESVKDFIERRNESYEKVSKHTDFDISLSAEIAYMRDIADVSDIEKLVIPGTQYLLIELPMIKLHECLFDDMYELNKQFGIKPIFAHMERYLDIFTPDNYVELASIENAVFQFNLFSFSDFRSRKFFKTFFRAGADFVVGTDAHGIGFRTERIPKGLTKLDKICGQYTDSVLSGEALYS